MHTVSEKIDMFMVVPYEMNFYSEDGLVDGSYKLVRLKLVLQSINNLVMDADFAEVRTVNLTVEIPKENTFFSADDAGEPGGLRAGDTIEFLLVGDPHGEIKEEGKEEHKRNIKEYECVFRLPAVVSALMERESGLDSGRLCQIAENLKLEIGYGLMGQSEERQGSFFVRERSNPGRIRWAKEE